MKKSTWSLLFSLILTFHLSAQKPGNTQNETTVNAVLRERLIGLRKISKTEISNIITTSNAPLAIGDSFPVYNENGTQLTQDELMVHFIKADSTDFYIDENFSVQAAVIKASRRSDEETEHELQGHMAPDFLVRDINGKNHSIERLRGKVVVLNFWFTECKDCVMGIPELNRLMYKYKDQEVVFLSLALDKTNHLKVFLEDYDFHYSIIPDSKEQADAYKVKLFPSNLVIDRNSKITMIKEGYSPQITSEMSNAIEEALKPAKGQ